MVGGEDARGADARLEIFMRELQRRAAWVWMPHAAHFCAARYCMFHLATVVGNGRWVVSTVGDYRPGKAGDRPRNGDQPEQIGAGRLYETMVFRAEHRKGEKPHDLCCLYDAVTSDGEMDMDAYIHGGDATRGHLAMCEKWDIR